MNYVVNPAENGMMDLASIVAHSANGDEIVLIDAPTHIIIHQIIPALTDQLWQLAKDVRVSHGITFKVKLWSNDNDASEATDRTLRTIPVWPGFLLRDQNGCGRIQFDENAFATVVTSGNPGFLKQAIVGQGYVAKVIEPIPSKTIRDQHGVRCA